MTRFHGMFWIGAALVAGVANYGVKQMVQNSADQLAAVQRKTIAEQKEIHVLATTWASLNRPELLADLNKRFLGLVAIAPKQLERAIADIPLRPAPIAPESPVEPPAVAALPSPVTPVAAVAPARVAAVVPVAAVTPIPVAPIAPPPRTRAAASAAPSLDTLFAQVAGSR